MSVRVSILVTCAIRVSFFDMVKTNRMAAKAMGRGGAALDPYKQLAIVLVAGVKLLTPLKTARASYRDLIGEIKTFAQGQLFSEVTYNHMGNIVLLHEQIVFTGILALMDMATKDEKVDALLKTVLFDAPASKERVAEAANALGLGADSPAVSMCSSVMDSYEEVALCTW